MTLVSAQPTGPNSISTLNSSRGNISNAAGTVEAQAGNVTELNIDATQITQAWQGYYGNITGRITLENSAGSVFYNWSDLGSVSGEVYASRDSAVDWSTIDCSNSSVNSDENDFLDRPSTAPDSVDNTYNLNSHPSFDVGTTTISANTCNSTNAYINTGQSATNFYQILLADSGRDIVYTTLIDADQVGFTGSQFDFELLVGENGNATEASSTTTYYFYIELS